MSKNVTRSTVNEQQYSAQQFPTSGFPLSHTRYSSYMLGRLHVSGYQDIVAGDKISGKNDGNFTFNRIVTPFVSPVDGLQYNFYLPFRTLDRTFERAFAPNKRNAMSKDWSTPTVNTRYLVQRIFQTYYGTDETEVWYRGFMDLMSKINEPTATLSDIDPGLEFLYNDGCVSEALYSLRTGAFHEMAKKMYIDDALIDIADNLEAKCGSLGNPVSGDILVQDFVFTFLDCLLTPFIGRYSYYGEFKYKYLRPNDLYRISRGIEVPEYGDMSSFYDIFDDTPQCEYALRAMYVVWYEYFRNVNLEEETDNLPYWRDFGSTSIFDLDAGGNLCYLVYRIRPWYEDMFINAQVDDMSRHVYAPIIDSSTEAIVYRTDLLNNHDANSAYDGDPGSSGSRVPAVYTLGWRDQMTGTNKVISCPVPANINDILADADESFFNVYGLDLNTLRQSKQLEQYLKRNYLFGDEYKDRMLAHYNSRVSDMRVNRPELLSQSINASNMNQEVSNVSTDETKVGDRTATMTITTGGDQFTTYCEEFGIVLHIVSFMPQAVYDGIHPQLLATKHVHYPLPEFATNNEEFGRKMEIADSALSATLIGENGSDNRFMFGRYMAYHAWRARVDEVGGQFLDELQECTFRRFWGLFSDDTTPKLNYYFLHCRPQLGMFANTNRYDTQLYGNTHHEFFVERVLPTPVEKI